MNKFKALILGTDHNSYAVARSYMEAFDDKAVVVGSAVLLPFYHSKIADVYTRKSFSMDDEIFVDFLNEVANKYPDTSFVFFAPTEAYIDILIRNIDKLNFDYRCPYPEKEMSEKLILKSNFHEFLEKIKVPYPKTQIINRDKIESLTLDGELFMKADQYEDFVLIDFAQKQKGYRVSGKDEAKKLLKIIFQAGYKGNMLVQTYINGEAGFEYSINGYRAHDGKISMVLARNIVSDKREMWVGNHIVQVDSKDQRFYALAKKIVNELDYHGLFNFDFKLDEKTGQIYTLEMNIRQGRTFYYAILGGVNLIEIAIKDMILKESVEKRGENKFRLMTLTENCLKNHVKKSLLDEFLEEKRVKNSANPIIYDKDRSLTRNFRIKESINKLEKEIFGN
ncbi:MAG: ATP-grasp domain-containing protein [Peptoniphilaceae bacterium]|nr:ATP-grasp domain-containing protein [Peptoniphilaceae bacterium]MDY6018773.1 ATP-grasp domain-containing protein [Anaerococcus sp.]